MAGQYHAVEPNGQHNIELQFQRSPSRTPSPPPRRFQGLPARRRPKARVWLGLCGKWLITIMFIIVVYIILIGYALYDVMSSKHKKYFNALITGFLIALGMSTMSQLTHAVGDMRWWILSKRPRSRQKVKAILHVNSMSQVIVLAFKSKRWRIHLGVLAWVALFLVSHHVVFVRILLIESGNSSWLRLSGLMLLSRKDRGHSPSGRRKRVCCRPKHCLDYKRC